MRALLIWLITFMVAVPVAQAQDGPRAPVGWSGQIEGFALWQGESALSNGGDFAINRGVLRGGAFYRWASGTSAGLQLSLGRSDYRFRNTAAKPWDDITDLQVSAPIRFRTGERGLVFLAPSLRYSHESGKDMQSGRTYGILAGIAWRVSPNLTIGPGLGVFTQIEDDDLDIFPALLIDWQFADRWALSTGGGLGATRGPGLSLTYDISDSFNISLSARSERVRFRLNNSGLAPNGVGQDRSTPVVLTANYEPNPAVSLTGFVGAEFNGSLKLENATGTVISHQSYDTAPIAGFAFRLRF